MIYDLRYLKNNLSSLQLRSQYCHILLIVSLSVFTFYRMFYNYFEADDYVWIKIAAVSSKNLVNIFTLEISNFFRPAVHFLYLISYLFSGLNPFGYYLVNLLFNIFNSILVYLIVYALFKNKNVAFLSGLIFTVYPTHFEAVIWISGLSELVGDFFYLLSLLSFIYYLDQKERKWYFLSLSSFALGLLSKENVVGLIAVLLLYDLVFYKKIFQINAIKKYIPFFIILIPYIIYQYEIQQSSYLVQDKLYSIGYHVIENFFNYLYSLLIPIPLTIPIMGTTLRYIIAILLVCIIITILIKGTDGLRFTAMWMVLSLLPFLFFTTGVTSRYSYLPSIGFSVLFFAMPIDWGYHKIKQVDLRLARILTGSIVLIIILISVLINNAHIQYMGNLPKTSLEEIKSTYPLITKINRVYTVGSLPGFNDKYLQSAIYMLYGQIINVSTIKLDQLDEFNSDPSNIIMKYENGGLIDLTGKTINYIGENKVVNGNFNSSANWQGYDGIDSFLDDSTFDTSPYSIRIINIEQPSDIFIDLKNISIDRLSKTVKHSTYREIYQYIDIEPNKMYIVRLMSKNNLTSGNALIYVKTFDEKNTYLNTYPMLEGYTLRGNTWTEDSFMFTSDNKATKAMLVLRNTGSGSVRFDSVRLQRIEINKVIMKQEDKNK